MDSNTKTILKMKIKITLLFVLCSFWAFSQQTLNQNKVKGLADSLAKKVNKVTGKGLSANDYTTTEKNKLAGIATGATANSSDATLLNRENHTGTQLSSTISDFNSATDARITGKENSLGNPGSDGYILSSTTGGTRSWIAPPTGATWGAITGTLSSQSDLNTALNLKANILTPTFTTSATVSSSGNTDLTISTSGTTTLPALNFRYNALTPFAKIEGNIASGEVKYYAATNYFPTFYANNSEVMRLTTGGHLLVGTATNTGEKLQVNGTSRFTGAITGTKYMLSALNAAPSSSTDTGTVGEIRVTADYIFICVGTNTWKRSPIFSTW